VVALVACAADGGGHGDELVVLRLLGVIPMGVGVGLVGLGVRVLMR
jgi:hypothetical protein